MDAQVIIPTIIDLQKRVILLEGLLLPLARHLATVTGDTTIQNLVLETDTRATELFSERPAAQDKPKIHLIN